MSFFPITSVPHLLNNHFHQKQAFRTCWTTIFIKSKRSALAEQSFSSKTCVPHLLNNHFYQKHAFRTPRTIIFTKNRRASPPEQSFLSKTDERHSPNNHFYQKQTSVTPRTIIFKINTQNAWELKQWTEQAYDATPQALKERTMGEIANGFDVYTSLLIV